MTWAQQRQNEGKIAAPFVLGAIIDLRHCLDLFDTDSLQQVREAHRELKRTLRAVEQPLPRNVGRTPDKAGRGLDCAVLNFLHEYRAERGDEAYDSVRGPFLEGSKLYPRAGFRNQNHIQRCVRNTYCIKGYFRPLARVLLPALAGAADQPVLASRRGPTLVVPGASPLAAPPSRTQDEDRQPRASVAVAAVIA